MTTRFRRIVVTVGLVAVALLVYLNYFRNPPIHNTGGDMPIAVLVAQVPIHKGTPASVITRAMYSTTMMRQSQVVSAAIIDPSRLRGEVATRSIPPGAQLTAADFAPAAPHG